MNNEDKNKRIISETEYNELLYRFLDPNDKLTELEMRRMNEYEEWFELQKQANEGMSRGRQYSLQGSHPTSFNDSDHGAINAIIIVLIVLCVVAVIIFIAMGLF